MTDLSLVLLTAEDAAGIEARYRLYVERYASDVPYDPPPSRRDLISDVVSPWTDQRVEHWLAWADGEAVGSLTMRFPALENTANVSLDLAVRPSSRRRGIGRQLADHAIQRARADNRIRMIAEVREGGPEVRGGHPGAAFARARGATRALLEVRRRLDLDSVDPSVHPQLLEDSEGASSDYHLVRWVSAMPEEILDGVAVLESRMGTDAPIGDLEVEPQRQDGARLREMERVSLERGRRVFGAATVHTASGVVAGYTMCAIVEDIPDHGWQWATIVLPEHRGHRLGLRLKAGMLVWLRDEAPAMRRIDTWNAAENTHMIAVNDRLGYRGLDTWAVWQLELGPA